MSILRAVTTTVFSFALMGAVFSPGAKADDWNRKTTIHFQRAGGDSGSPPQGMGACCRPAPMSSRSWTHSPTATSSRSSAQDEKTVYATILAIPNYRLKATDKTVITFRERPAGEPEALRAWFYPGRNWGEEFVYPKARAVELAKTTNTPILFMPVEIPVEVATADRSGGRAGGRTTEAGAHHGNQPDGRRGGTRCCGHRSAGRGTSAGRAPVTAAVLPATSSPLPLIALFGLLALGGALGLGLVQKRVV